jgi:hypothetical protein
MSTQTEGRRLALSLSLRLQLDLRMVGVELCWARRVLASGRSPVPEPSVTENSSI